MNKTLITLSKIVSGLGLVGCILSEIGFILGFIIANQIQKQFEDLGFYLSISIIQGCLVIFMILYLISGLVFAINLFEMKSQCRLQFANILMMIEIFLYVFCKLSFIFIGFSDVITVLHIVMVVLIIVLAIKYNRYKLFLLRNQINQQNQAAQVNQLIVLNSDQYVPNQVLSQQQQQQQNYPTQKY